MDKSLPGKEIGRDTPDATGPPNEAPELGHALRLLGLALVSLLRRSRGPAIAFLHRVANAGSQAWGRFRGAVHRAPLLWPVAALTRATRLGPDAERGIAKVQSGAGITANRFRRAARPSESNRLLGFDRHRFRAFALGILCAIAFLLTGAIGFLGYCAFTLPLSGGLAAQPSPPVIIIEDDAGKAFASRGNFRGEPVAFDQLPANLVNAVLAIEDRHFFEHPGIDLSGILRAALRDLKSGAIREGGSTITQQLVRLTYLSPERTIKRKVQEAMLAIWLETRLSKQEILTRYLNTAYFGAGAYGVDAAAKRYFGKGAQSLDLAESAMLAGLIRAPSALSPIRDLEAAQQRADTVLQAMTEAGFIARSQAANARAHPARLAIPPETEPGSNYFVDAAAAEVQRLLGSPPTDLTVRSTFDPVLQNAAERVVDHWLDTEGRARGAGQAALVALAPDGAIVSMYGGRDYTESQFNRVTQARRQPGSLFKIFVYLAAFNAGYTPDSTLVDQPVEIGNWKPNDYGGRFRGPVTLRTAFAQSLNSISVQLVQQVGVERVIEMAKSLGVKSELPAVPSLALGTAEVTLLEMTAAMNAIAIDSKSVEPYSVQAIRTNGKTKLYTHPEVTVTPPGWNRAEILDLLQAVVSEGTGKAARLDRPVAGKTGTSEDYRDAWFVGFTSDFVVGVWVGNDDDAPMKEVVGGDLPAKIWHDFVAAAEQIKASRSTAAANASAATGSSTPPAAGSPSVVEGVPRVVDTATLAFGDRIVHLAGVSGESGEPARDMTSYIGGRSVNCRPADPSGSQYRCRLGAYDLAQAVLFNGGGRATADASPDLKSAEEMARAAKRGLWKQ